jgi:NAD(P) transhydrogenase subunit alpha
MNPNVLADEAVRIADRAQALAGQIRTMATVVEPAAQAAEPFIYLFAVFLMACFVGYYVVWNVTPALHSPLMAVTNAISSVIIVGAILAVGLAPSAWATFFGFLAVVLASVNIFGGFMVTRRMLGMFQANKKAAKK